MKKSTFLILIFSAFIISGACVRAKPGCKKNIKKIKKMRKNNPGMVM